LGDGYRTLESVTVHDEIGELCIRDGLSGRLVRDEQGTVVSVERITPWGRVIGKEEEW